MTHLLTICGVQLWVYHPRYWRECFRMGYDANGRSWFVRFFVFEIWTEGYV